jgi:two-component system sensor histidine kinase RegB
MLGVWVSLAVGILFFAGYAWRVAEEARRLHNALSATQLALDREQRISEIGGLAAAAAHALGSPLGTIAIAAREIARELPEDSPMAEDARLLVSETIRCRDILAELAVKPRDEPGSPFSLLPIGAVVEAAARRHEVSGVEILYDAGPEPDAAASKDPMTVPSAEIIHGLGSLIQNAVQFARTRTTVTTRWNDDAVSVTVADDGPGFPPMVLERLGEPYLSVRAEEGEHMGLGIFIAQTLLQRTGATLRFRNLPVRGAEVSVRWRRGDLEGRPRQAEVLQNEGIA